MSTTKQQRIAKGMTSAARIIGLCVTFFFFLASIIILNYGELGVGDVLVLVSFGIVLAGCIASWWREWLAGILLTLTTFTLVTGVALYWNYWWWLLPGSLLLVAGVLFLISSWLLQPGLSPAFVLWGALWFGLGGVIAGTVCAGNHYLLILGFIILGGLGGGALGLVFGGGKKVGLLALGGAIGFGFGFAVGLSLEFSGFTGILEPIYEGLVIGCVTGAIGGAALGLALRNLRASGILALAGAFGLGTGTYLSLFIGMTASGMTSWGVPPDKDPELAGLLGLVSLFLMGALTGAALGAGMSWIKRLKTQNAKSSAKPLRRRISGRLKIPAAIFTFLVLAALLAWYVTSATLRADVVEFPDKNLRVVVETAIGKWLGGQITSADLARVTELHTKWRGITDLGITDLSGLEYCTNLTTLILDRNQIANISSLSSLTNLTYLDLTGNQISDVSPLSFLTNLTTLILDGGNQIANVSPLSSLTNLTYLDLSGNQISDVSPLSSLTSLTTLILDGTQTSDVSHLSSLTKLEELSLNYNQIGDLTPLASLTNLSQLYLDENQISDISPLASLTNLDILRLCGNQISDISALSSLTRLTALWLQWNQVSDISPLVENAGLGEGDQVWIGQNNLDLSEGSEDMHDVRNLEKRGVTVYLEF